jgi:hypothetical protein
MTHEQSIERLAHGKEALARGDLRGAAKDLSASLAFEINPEAYFLRAEVHYLLGELHLAFEDLEKLESLSLKLQNTQSWLDLINQSRIRYDMPVNAKNPLVAAPDQPISVMMPTALIDSRAILQAIVGHPDLRMSGHSLFEEDGRRICDLRILEHNSDSAKAMIDWRDQNPFGRDIIRQIQKHAMLVQIDAPCDVASANSDRVAESQTMLAIRMMQVTNAVMTAISAPVAFFRYSAAVHQLDEIQSFCTDLTAYHLVDAYASTLYRGGLTFSVGMRCLGFADVQIYDGVTTKAVAADVLYEFMVYEVIHERALLNSDIRFTSEVTGETYEMTHIECQSWQAYDALEDPRANPFGIWSIERIPEIIKPRNVEQQITKVHRF